MLKRSLAFALLAVGTTAHAAILYNNTGDIATAVSVVNNNFVADDFVFSPSETPGGANISATINSLELGFNYSGATISGFDILVNVYKDSRPVHHRREHPRADESWRSRGRSRFRPQRSCRARTLPARSIPAASASGPSTTSITSNHGIEIRFLNAGTSVLNPNVTALFKGDVPPTVGESEIQYYRESNGNGFIDGSDLRDFGGGATRAPTST